MDLGSWSIIGSIPIALPAKPSYRRETSWSPHGFYFFSFVMFFSYWKNVFLFSFHSAILIILLDSRILCPTSPTLLTALTWAIMLITMASATSSAITIQVRWRLWSRCFAMTFSCQRKIHGSSLSVWKKTPKHPVKKTKHKITIEKWLGSSIGLIGGGG